MKRSHQIIGATLLSGTALGGAGIQQQRALDQYIVASLADAEDPKTELTARYTLDAMKETSALYGRALITGSAAGNDPGNKQKREASDQAASALVVKMQTIYDGRDFRPQVADMVQKVESLRKAFNIKQPVTAAVLPFAHLQARADYTGNKKSPFSLSASFGILDTLTPDQMTYVLAHETGHFKNDLTDAQGNPKPAQRISVESDLKQAIRQSIGRELEADKDAIKYTCDPVTATGALARMEALSNDMTPNDLRLQLQQKLNITPTNLAKYLVEAAKPRMAVVALSQDGKHFVEDPHPDWKSRIKTVIATADEHCKMR